MSDLLEPRRLPLSDTEMLERRWRLLVTAFTAATLYTVLHKLLIPLVLKGTALNSSVYSKIDWWFLQPLVFCILLRKRKGLSPFLCVLAGVSIAYGIFEIYETAAGRNPGWLGFSRLLSSLPIAGLCLVMMTYRQFGRRLDLAWSGAIFFALLAVVFQFVPQQGGDSITAHPTPVSMRSGIPSMRDCGAESLTLIPEEADVLPHGSVVTFDTCGFHPTRFVLLDEPLQLVNATDQAANFHLVTQEKGRLRTLWNVLVPPRQQLKAAQFKLREGAIAMVYSDNRPQAGVVAIVRSVYLDHWRLSRSPLILEARP